MKSKMVLFLVLSLVLLLISPACSADFDTNRLTGSFYPAAAERICSGTSDPYGFWTQDSSYKSFLAIALEKDFCREEPLGYNYCFPINSLACVLSYSGARKDNTIRVMYVCFDAYLTMDYNLDTRRVSFAMDKTIPEIESFHTYVDNLNQGYYGSQFYTYEDYGFYEANDSFNSGFRLWTRFSEQHPELNS